MEPFLEPVNGNGFFTGNEYLLTTRGTPPLSWLDVRVFYVRLSKCELQSSATPHHLTLNHIPLNSNTLLEINGVRANFYADNGGVLSTTLRRDRVDKTSDEATFVSTDSVRVTGAVKFEVLDNEMLILSGVLKRDENGYVEDAAGGRDVQRWKWSLNCELNAAAGVGYLRRRKPVNGSRVVGSPVIEVCVAGCFSGDPIILSKTLKLNSCSKKVVRNGTLNSIPESDDDAPEELRDDTPSALSSRMLELELPDYRSINEGAYYFQHSEHFQSRTEYLEGEDVELSWFNAGLRVGVGIGLSICLGIGLGVGLVAKTYHGTTSNFRRRLL